MKVIPISAALDAYATELATNYQADFALDLRPNKRWRATSTDAKIFVRTGTSNTVAVFGFPANDFGIYVYDEVSSLATNPGFEIAGTGATTFSDWTGEAGDGEIVDELAICKNGSHSVKLTSGASANTRLYQEIASPATGRRYDFSAWFYPDGTHAPRMKLDYFDGAEWNSLATLTQLTITAATWQQAHISADCPGSATTIRAFLQSPASSGGYFYADDVIVTPATAWINSSLSNIVDYYTFFMDQGGPRAKEFWFEYPLIETNHVVEIDILSSASDVAELGVIFPGLCQTYTNPRYGLRESRISNSTLRDLYAGGTYCKNRGVTSGRHTYPDNIKQYQGSIELRDEDMISFLSNVVDTVGPQPCAWKVDHISGASGHRIVLGSMTSSLPEASHEYFNLSVANLTIKGVR